MMEAAAEIIGMCERLGKFEKMKVARWLVEKKIRCLEHADGIRVNLDALGVVDQGELLVYVRGLKQEPLINID